MTIRRKYSLPNCTLVLEGMGDSTSRGGSQLDARPLMTILVNAECHFSGIEQPLSGGRDFLDSLVRAVSRYAQEFLSQVHHPKMHGERPELVQFQKLPDRNMHRMILQPAADAVAASAGVGMGGASYSGMAPGRPVHMDLTTVQLFDLVEAIDQFLADRRTLPDFAVSLEPLSKRHKKADEPLAKRAAPAALGVTGLAISAAALFLVPPPREPKTSATSQPNPNNQTNANNKANSPSPTSSPSATATPRPSPPSSSELESTLNSNQEITDATQLRFLQRRLYRKIDENWKNRRQVEQTLEYRVAVGKDGAIIGYKPVDQTPIEGAKQTPLPDLLYIPATGSNAAPAEPIGQFRVVFNKRGVLQVSPWRGYTAQPSLGPEISDSAAVGRLKDQLYKQIRENWTTTPTFPKDLEYRVAVTEEGVIADYEEKNQPASDYLDQTPLDKLAKPEAAGMGSKETGLVPQKPLAHFRVVFKSNGALEVSSY
jgi:hypothetical protein